MFGDLWNSRNNKRKSISFVISMIWREGKHHITDCFFCTKNPKEINCKNKHHAQYFKGVCSVAGFTSQKETCWLREQLSTGIETVRGLSYFFKFEDKSSLVYFNNIAVLIKSMGLEYDATECRLLFYIYQPLRSGCD